MQQNSQTVTGVYLGDANVVVLILELVQAQAGRGRVDQPFSTW